MCFVAAGICCNLSLPNLILLGREGERRRDEWVCSFAYHCFLMIDACPRAVIFGELVPVFIAKAPTALGAGFQVCKSK